MGQDNAELIAEAREWSDGWTRPGEDERAWRPFDQTERIPFWDQPRTAITDAENTRRHDAMKQWESIHGHDPRQKCYAEFGCLVIESYSVDLVVRLAYALERVTPRVVTEVAELDALPLESVIRWDNGVEYVSAERGYGVWMVAGSDNNLDSNEVTLPATVLFTPTGKETE